MRWFREPVMQRPFFTAYCVASLSSWGYLLYVAYRSKT